MTAAEFIPKSLSKSIQKASFTWQTPSNIALVKYWGKSDPQIPKNASISFTLNKCNTITTVAFYLKENLTSTNTDKDISFELFFEGEKKEEFKPKIEAFFKRILKYCPYILAYRMVINSENSFPHSSGIASSASGLSAISMCLLSLERLLSKTAMSDSYLKKKGSFLARLGSGSASRSVEGPIMVWGSHPEINGSSNLYSILFPYKVHSVFKNYQDTVLLVEKSKKQVSSSIGHNLMHKHPYAKNRFTQANENVLKLTKIFQEGNLNAFVNLVESEALTLHAMMLTSSPHFILMKPNTLEIINKIWEYRALTKSNICFTLDAGANVHVLYPEAEKEKVLTFIADQLSIYCEKNQYICDNTGLGANQL